MHNLKLIRFSAAENEFPNITKLCWDPAQSEVICANGPSQMSPTISLSRLSERTLGTQEITAWEATPPTPDLAHDSIVSLHHFSDTATTCLVFTGGDIVTVQETPSYDAKVSSPATVEIIGSIDSGITAAAWSPDEEVLILLSKSNIVSFMGRDFNPLAELPMVAEDLSLSKHVSVGWGKKETQFEGRGAKALRDPTIPLKVDQGEPSPFEDGTTTIAWRGDGAIVAVNSVFEGSRRAIRVYTRDGVLDGVSEPVDGLESALTWRPSGNLLAGVQRLPDDEGIKIVFFERNGLRHGDFMLRDKTAKSIKLQWNCDSTVLAIQVDSTLQLWTTNNYHWYLKQVFPQFSPVRHVSWHSERPLSLAVASDSDVFTAEYAFTISRGHIIPPKDLGIVAIIDGTHLLLTPFRSANVPPPMAFLTLEAKAPITSVAFSANNSILAVVNGGNIALFALKTKKGKFVAALPITMIPDVAGPGEFISEISALHDTHTQFVVSKIEYGNSTVSVITVDLALSSASVGVIGLGFEGTPRFVALSPNGFMRPDNCGGIFKPDPFLAPSSASLPNNLLTWSVIYIDGTELAVGLSRNGVLYAGSKNLAKNCTSFLTTPDHIVFTTNTHLVKFVHITANPEDLQVPTDDPEIDERCRSIERGGKLVTAIPTQMSLILQMPRGNLETIFPRAMVVAGIRALIDIRDYGAAFAVCRTHRVDMNLLFDHRPKQFLNNVRLVLDQVREPASIDLFLSSLKPENVAETMYRNTKSAPDESTESGSAPIPPEKVNTICDAVLSSLSVRSGAANIQNTITAHICKQPPATDDGLQLVAQLQDTDEALAERAVEHICFLADANMLYDHALGLYNLRLALLVAQQAQKDPREYVPFIQDLHAQSELRRKFTIDDHLGRREKALVHLHDLDVFDDEFTRYTVKYGLYKPALALYRYDAPRHAALTLLFAKHLESRSQNQEAGLAYESLGRHADATKCYRAAGATCWQECLYNAQIQTPALSATELADLTATLAEALFDAKEYEACAAVNTDYLQNFDEAVRALCKGYHFSSAIRTVTLHNRSDLLTSAVDPGIVDALSNTTEFLAQCKSQLAAQVPRILELRQRAAEDPLAFYEGERGGDIPDDISVAASSRISAGDASLFTRYTGTIGSVGTGVSRATSKNRRREEKKRARGRKGTVYEEEYLVASVRRLVERVDGSRAETERLVAALVRRNMQERARAVEKLFAEMAEGCKKAVVTVFGEPENEKVKAEGIEGEIYIPSGAEAVMIDSLQNKTKKQEPPIIKAMERLSLLG